MRFRQVHLDFHTPELIPGIGSQFSAKQFQAALKRGHVDSITVFAKCHHGWAYFPSTENEKHPYLQFDLLGEQIAAAHEIGVRTPVYLSAGFDQKEVLRHPEWLIRTADGRMQYSPTFHEPGYQEFCMNSAYLNKLVRQTEEVVRKYDADGIFLDIVGIRECYCHNCTKTMLDEGMSPTDPEAIRRMGERTYANYTRRINAAIHAIKPAMEVFHNSGHICRGRRDLAAMSTHLELESLPTGGWGYDHFPLSAAYVRTLGMDYLGMTGKFHNSWGEFGGYKHPNALRYECSVALAFGARISVGDQLHPSGSMDKATYELIGTAYREVEEKEEYCRGAQAVVDMAILSVEACGRDKHRGGPSDAGAIRILMETNALFDVVDTEADFGRYKLLILPDKIRLTLELAQKLKLYLENGGKILATGESGLDAIDDEFAVDLGVAYEGKNEFRPDYVRPNFRLPSIDNSAFVCYAQGHKVDVVAGETLGTRENPYFNRSAFSFSSHLHTPNRPEPAGAGIVESTSGIYIAWDIFEDYALNGSNIHRDIVAHAIDRLLPSKTVATALPAQGLVTLTKQDEKSRYVLHVLYGAPVRRGKSVEVIEDLPALVDTDFVVRMREPVKSVTLVPQNVPVAFVPVNGGIQFTIPKFSCHQMVELVI